MHFSQTAQRRTIGPLLGLFPLLALLASCAGHPRPETSLAESLDAWRDPRGSWLEVGNAATDRDDPKRLNFGPGTGVLVNGEKGNTVNLLTVEEYGDVQAHIEFMVPEGSNSGVYFMGRYEVQVLDSWGEKNPKHGDCGGIYQRWDPSRGEGNEGFEGHPPRINASKPPGEWQTFEVTFHAPRFNAEGEKVLPGKFVRVVHNGTVVHENVDVYGPTRSASFEDEGPLGPLMLQGDHGPVAYRNIRIQPLGGSHH